MELSLTKSQNFPLGADVYTSVGENQLYEGKRSTVPAPFASVCPQMITGKNVFFNSRRTSDGPTFLKWKPEFRYLCKKEIGKYSQKTFHLNKPAGSAIAVNSGGDKSMATPKHNSRIGQSFGGESARTYASRKDDTPSLKQIRHDCDIYQIHSQLVVPNTNTLDDVFPVRTKRAWSSNSNNGSLPLKSILSSRTRGDQSTGSTPNLNILRKKVAFSRKVMYFNIDDHDKI